MLRLIPLSMDHQQNVVDDGADDQPQPSFTRYSPEANAQSKQAAVELVGRQHLSQKYNSYKTARETASTKPHSLIGYRCRLMK